MKLLITTSVPELERRASPHLGRLVTPRCATRPDVGTTQFVWACDNDAYSGWHEERYRRMLAKFARLPGCRFVSARDVVGDSVSTLAYFDEYEPLIRQHGLPVALVAQDGLTLDRAPWERIDALFIGGTDAFKDGPDAARLIVEAKRRGKWVHVGRVNTRRRFMRCAALGVDSVDGSSFGRFPAVYIPKALSWFDEIAADPPWFQLLALQERLACLTS